MRKPFAAMMTLVLTLSGIVPVARIAVPETAPAYASPPPDARVSFGDPFRTRVTFPCHLPRDAPRNQANPTWAWATIWSSKSGNVNHPGASSASC